MHVLALTGQSAQTSELSRNLLREVAAAEMRVGLLQHAEMSAVQDLEHAVGSGACRAAVVSADGSLLLKPRRALPRLDDLLREQFLGCRVVLLQCASDSRLLEGASAWGRSVRLVVLTAAAAGWHLRSPRDPDGAALALSSEQLVKRLRRPYLLPEVTASTQHASG